MTISAYIASLSLLKLAKKPPPAALLRDLYGVLWHSECSSRSGCSTLPT